MSVLAEDASLTEKGCSKSAHATTHSDTRIKEGKSMTRTEHAGRDVHRLLQPIKRVNETRSALRVGVAPHLRHWRQDIL